MIVWPYVFLGLQIDICPLGIKYQINLEKNTQLLNIAF